MKRITIFLALALLTHTANAGCYPTYCKGVGRLAMSSLHIPIQGDALIGAPSDRENLNCDLVNGRYMTLSRQSTGYQNMLESIRYANQNKKRLTIRIQENSPNCRILYVRYEL